MFATGLQTIGWSVVFVTVAAVSLVSVYLFVLVVLSAVAPGAFT